MANLGTWGRASRELVLIVTGVLVALAVENWWGDVRERQDEGRYLIALQEELASNLGSIEGSLGFREEAEVALETAVRLLDSGRFADSAAVFIGSLMNAGIFGAMPQVNDAVFQDLNSTGSSRLIRDDDLRREIRIRYAELAVNSTRLAEAQERVRGRLDALVVEHTHPGVLERPRPLTVTVVGQGPQLRAVATEIARDPRLRPELNRTAFALRSVVGYLAFARQRLEAYRALLDAALADRS